MRTQNPSLSKQLTPKQIQEINNSSKITIQLEDEEYSADIWNPILKWIKQLNLVNPGLDYKIVKDRVVPTIPYNSNIHTKVLSEPVFQIFIWGGNQVSFPKYLKYISIRVNYLNIANTEMKLQNTNSLSKDLYTYGTIINLQEMGVLHIVKNREYYNNLADYYYSMIVSNLEDGLYHGSLKLTIEGFNNHLEEYAKYSNVYNNAKSIIHNTITTANNTMKNYNKNTLKNLLNTYQNTLNTIHKLEAQQQK